MYVCSVGFTKRFEYGLIFLYSYFKLEFDLFDDHFSIIPGFTVGEVQGVSKKGCETVKKCCDGMWFYWMFLP